MADAKKKAPVKAAKTTKKAAPKKDISPEQTLAELRETLVEQRRSLASGELMNPRAITKTRKDIARTLTKINANKESK